MLFEITETWQCSNCKAKFKTIYTKTHNPTLYEKLPTTNRHGEKHQCHTGKKVYGILKFVSLEFEENGAKA